MAFRRRLLFAPVVLVAVAAVTYGIPRILRPDRYPGEHFISGLWHDLDRVFLHLDFGCAVMLRGCPSTHGLWVRGLAWFSFIAVSAPLTITNMVLVERTLSVPGFFKYTWRAAGHEICPSRPVTRCPTSRCCARWACGARCC
jgi:hypothetical protein